MSASRPILVMCLLVLIGGAASAQNVGVGVPRGAAIGALPQYASVFYFAAKASKQGALVTETGGGQWDRYQVGLSVDLRAESPTDRATGLPSGQIQFTPLAITRQVGPASPQFLQAVATNENFPQVLLKFFKSAPGGEVWYELTLQNARLVRVHQYMGLPPGATVGTPILLEELAFSYQTLTAHHMVAGTMAVVGK